MEKGKESDTKKMGKPKNEFGIDSHHKKMISNSLYHTCFAWKRSGATTAFEMVSKDTGCAVIRQYQFQAIGVQLINEVINGAIDFCRSPRRRSCCCHLSGLP